MTKPQKPATASCASCASAFTGDGKGPESEKDAARQLAAHMLESHTCWLALHEKPAGLLGAAALAAECALRRAASDAACVVHGAVPESVAAAAARPIAEDDPEVVAEAERTHTETSVVVRSLRINAAMDEARALKEWQRAGLGERPSTPNLDAIRGGTAMSKTSTKTRAAAKPAVEYTRNGKHPIRTRPWTLGYVAAQCTAGIKTGVDRLSTAQLVDELKKLGVKDPHAPGWEVTLPNGVTLGAVEPGTALPEPKAAAGLARRPAAKAVKQTPKARAAKAVAKATRTVTPNFKDKAKPAAKPRPAAKAS